jgi:hypothetical protein
VYGSIIEHVEILVNYSQFVLSLKLKITEPEFLGYWLHIAVHHALLLTIAFVLLFLSLIVTKWPPFYYSSSMPSFSVLIAWQISRYFVLLLLGFDVQISWSMWVRGQHKPMAILTVSLHDLVGALNNFFFFGQCWKRLSSAWDSVIMFLSPAIVSCFHWNLHTIILTASHNHKNRNLYITF